jgi:hypothetical protein
MGIDLGFALGTINDGLSEQESAVKRTMEGCLVNSISQLAEAAWTTIVAKILEGGVSRDEETEIKTWRETFNERFKHHSAICDGVLSLDYWAFPRTFR